MVQWNFSFYITYIKSLVSPLGTQCLQRLLSGPSREVFANTWPARRLASPSLPVPLCVPFQGLPIPLLAVARSTHMAWPLPASQTSHCTLSSCLLL